MIKSKGTELRITKALISFVGHDALYGDLKGETSFDFASRGGLESMTQETATQGQRAKR